PIRRSLQAGLVPLVHGDVALDTVRGGTITSTETIFTFLTTNLPVSRIILLGKEDGVYDQQGAVIPEITPDNFIALRSALGGSDGTDVTGGMLTKVQDSLQLATNPPYPIVQIANGLRADLLRNALLGEEVDGTTITRG
ncbi:MAG: amino acid kinase, partial [Anaerolineae bacterium]|nr:amino acid kinase [Anaerolineae bacterium]